jgi:predicted outer membrane repeat protein
MPPINLFVNTTVDENDGGSTGQGLSLRDAILTANADTANEYVIVLQGGSTYTLSLNNSSGDEEQGRTGDLDITGGARISIVTSDGNKAVISAAGITSGDRAFDVLANARLTLNNVEITGGSTQDSGGAINIAKDASVVIEKSVIKDNTAAVDGGAIYNKGNLSISESSIEENNALVGAGIANYNSAVISKSSITGNDGVSGGAIYNRDSLILSESNISGNNATFGGAVYNSGDDLNITGSTITSNSALVAGGAVYSNGNAQIEKSNIANNISGKRGGGIINLENASLTVIATNVSGNKSEIGGGVDNLGTATLVSSTLNNNIADNGGGMSNSGDYAKATLVNATVSGNSATVNGGGIANEAQLNIVNATIVNNVNDSNSDGNGNGGGIFNAAGASATLKNTIVAQNPSNDLFGSFKGNANNLIGNTTGASGTIATGNDIINGNPLIGPLQDNGSGVLTHLLLTGSGAIDKGNNSFLTKDIFDLDGDGDVSELIPFDGKGGIRIVNGTVDIGAIEFLASNDGGGGDGGDGGGGDGGGDNGGGDNGGGDNGGGGDGGGGDGGGGDGGDGGGGDGGGGDGGGGGEPVKVEPPTIPADKPGVIAFDKLPKLDFSKFNPFGAPGGSGNSEPAFELQRLGDLPKTGGLRSLLAAATASESIKGSFVTDSVTDSLTFAKTGDPMGSGVYQMTLNTDGMTDENGNPIDGDGDGKAGGKFIQTFNVDNTGKRTFRLDDFVAGPGQAVKLPSSGGQGIDINIDDATGVTKIEFDFVFDEDILGVSGVSRGANLPSSWNISSQIEAPGRLQVVLSGAEAIQGGAAQLINVVADVLPTVAYGSSELLQLDQIELNDGAIASIGDVGVHQVGKLGDLSGNGEYTSLDAALLSRVVQGIDNGFRSSPLIDGNILGDINSNSSLTAEDVMSIAKKSVGLPQNDII